MEDQEQVSTDEQGAEVAPEPTPQPDHDAEIQRLAQINLQREHQLRQSASELAELKKRQEELSQSAEQLSQFKRALEDNDFSFFEKQGLSYDKWTNHELEKPSPEAQELQELKKTVKSLLDGNKEREQREAQAKEQLELETAERQKQQDYLVIKREVLSKSEGDSLGYSNVFADASAEQIREAYLEEQAKTPGVRPDAGRIAAAVEKAHEEELTTQMQALLKLPKFRQLILKLQGENESSEDGEDTGSGLAGADLSEAIPGEQKKRLTFEQARAEGIKAAQAAMRLASERNR